MRGVFKVVGVILIILAVVSTIYSLPQSALLALLSGFMGVVNGILFIVVGELMQRVDAAEWNLAQLQTPKPDPAKKRACFRCGQLYGVDRLKCPYCGADRE